MLFVSCPWSLLILALTVHFLHAPTGALQLSLYVILYLRLTFGFWCVPLGKPTVADACYCLDKERAKRRYISRVQSAL